MGNAQRPWRSVVVGILFALAATAICFIVFWQILRAVSPERQYVVLSSAYVPAILLGGAIAAVLLTVLFVNVVERLQQRTIQRVIAATRRLSSGNLTNMPFVAGDGEMALVSNALNVLRSRLLSQMELIDRQRRMLESLVDHLREGVVVARSDGRIALINPTAIHLLNLSPHGGADERAFLGRHVEACIPQHALQQLLVGPLDAPGSDASHSQGGPRYTGDTATRLEVQSSSGTAYLLARVSELLLAEPTEGETDAAVGRVVVLTDITELQRTIQMRTDFVANASHELRTPLSTIRAAIETLLTMDLLTEGPAATQFLTKIDRQSLRLQQMVADLLDLSRIESPTERFEPEPVDCRKWLSDMQARFVDRLERKGLHWETTVEPVDLTTVLVNPHLLRLALDNLVDNATKFTEAGGTIHVRICALRDEIEISVEDNGCGIPEQDQQRVFERFYQVERARSGPERGTGLGLSIVRHAVGAMHGRVQLESKPGEGTSVRMRIPAVRPAAAI
jgi:signal transduction histidine kinase